MVDAASGAASNGSPVVVLVHGAFADGSSWSKVVPPLQRAGYRVIAVQNPLTSLADDVKVTLHAIESVKPRPVLLAGHSFGGAVITEAGNHPQVKGLVYVAAGAPDSGQSFNDWWAPYPPAPIAKTITLSPGGGGLEISEQGVRENFTQDLGDEASSVVWSVSGYLGAHTFDEKVSKAAWRSKPSWYIVAENDRTIPPQAEIDTAKRLKATTITLKSDHVPMLSQPDKVAQFILQATQSVAAQ